MRSAPEEATAWLGLAQVLEREGRFPEALAALEQARRIGGAIETVLERRAFLAACLGRARTEELLQSDRRLARVVVELRREAIARSLDRRFGRRPPSERGSEDARRRAEKHVDEARRVLAKDVRRACDALLEAVRTYPLLDFEVLSAPVPGLVAAHREEAAEELLAGLADATLDLDLLQRLATFYRTVPALRPDRMQARRQRLASCLDAIARLYPSCAAVDAERGAMLVDEGRIAEAEAALQRLMSNPSTVAAGAPLETLLHTVRRSPPAAYEAGAAWVERARRFGISDEEAAVAWEEALRANPYEVRALVGLGSLFLSQRHYPQALQLLTAAFEQTPESLEVARLLAQAWLEAGLHAKGLDAAQFILGRWPHPQAWELLATALQASDRDAEAKAARAMAVAAPGEWTDAAQALWEEATRMHAARVLQP